MTDHFGFVAQEKAVRWLKAAITDLEGVAIRMELADTQDDKVMADLNRFRAKFIRERLAMIQAAKEAIENPVGLNREGQPNGGPAVCTTCGFARHDVRCAVIPSRPNCPPYQGQMTQSEAAGELAPVIEGRSVANGEGKAMRASPNPGGLAAIEISNIPIGPNDVVAILLDGVVVRRGPQWPGYHSKPHDSKSCPVCLDDKDQHECTCGNGCNPGMCTDERDGGYDRDDLTDEEGL